MFLYCESLCLISFVEYRNADCLDNGCQYAEQHYDNMPSVLMLNDRHYAECYDECHCVECHYAIFLYTWSCLTKYCYTKCRFAECCYAECLDNDYRYAKRHSAKCRYA
jgi:hypothetical protein